MTEEKIVERVKKLLALSQNNPSQEEAESAALKAQQLLAEYHISLEEFEAEDDIDVDVSDVGGTKKWRFVLAKIVADNFRCKTFAKGNNVAFYGHQPDVAVAKETYEYLFKVAQRAGRHEAHVAFNASGTSAGVYNSYVLGFADGVKKALDKQCTALRLVVPEEVNTAYNEYSADFSVRRNNVVCRGNIDDMAKARNAGFEHGKVALSGRHIEG